MLTLIKDAIKPENVTKKALNKFSSLRATSIKEIKIQIYGELKEVHIAKDRETGKSRGFAFIKFSSLKDGQKAVKELDGAEFHGRKISVQESNESRGGSSNRRRHGRK